MFSTMNECFGITQAVFSLAEQAEKDCQAIFSGIDQIAQQNQYKVLHAMQQNKLSDIHFAATSGYGYNDLGRDTLEAIYAQVFKGAAALVRPQIVSGTHALTLALAGNLRPGDNLLMPAGMPYDTLQGVIGIRREQGDLMEYGIGHTLVALKEDGSFDYEQIEKAMAQKHTMALIQRSRGYSLRKSFALSQIEQLIGFLKKIDPQMIVLVDNCYGEFVEKKEPLEIGADLIAGSLIKNPGGGLAPIGGYIVGKEPLIEACAARLTAPGLGKEVGATLGQNQPFLQGLFLASEVVAGAVKSAVFTARLFSLAGFGVSPTYQEPRTDIVQTIILQKPEYVVSYCTGIQKAAPVDSFVTPEPWAMPGYDCDVIMAAGAFVQGSSIELSADAPMKPPYAVFTQGGLTWHHGKIGALMGLQKIVDDYGIQL